jgi:hypothetical protein
MWFQVQKLLNSEALVNAHHLQKFLAYVTSKTIEGLPDEIKEYSIGREVFGRPENYDPRIDTVVRVQAHRLREKLQEYYDGQGAGDALLLEIPKGHYIPRFSRRADTPACSANGQPLTSSPEAPDVPRADLRAAVRKDEVTRLSTGPISPRLRTGVLIALSLVTGVALTLFGTRITRSLHLGARALHTGALPGSAPNPVSHLWTRFVNTDSSPIVAYSNAVFLSTESSDLLRVRTGNVGDLGPPASMNQARELLVNPRILARTGPLFFTNVYTGTGEVMAVFYLTRMFSQLHVDLTVERSRLVTTADLWTHNVIFLGSTQEDAMLAGLPLTQDFAFSLPRGPVSLWKLRLLNLHPQPGELTSYGLARDPISGAVRTDYALVSFLPGIAPNRKIVVLGGLTTLGTQAAAKFATSPLQINDLAKRLGTGPGSSPKIPPFFQAVLRVDIMKGDILSVTYVTGRVIHPRG